MQKLAVILLVVLVSACHKEFVSNTDQSRKLMVRNTINTIVPVAEKNELNWEQMEAIELGVEVIGYKIPFNKNTSTSYSFIFANFSNNEVGPLYRNEIKYAPFHGGMYPVSIHNYSYATKETAEYDTRKPVEKTTVKMGMLHPMSLMSAGLHFPAVTACGVLEPMPDQLDKATRVETYILGYLLGFGETVASVVKSTIPTLAYYNPLAANLSQKERKSIITWDIVR